MNTTNDGRTTSGGPWRMRRVARGAKPKNSVGPSEDAIFVLTNARSAARQMT